MKKLIVLLILITCIILVMSCGMRNNSESLDISSDVDFSDDDYKKIVPLNNQLGFKLLSQVESDKNGNTFISPVSLFMALSMIYNGTDGVTKTEIAKVLQNEGIDVNDLNKANASLLSMFDRDSKQIQLKVANSIWLNENFHFQSEFSQNNRDYFNAESQEINIYESESAKRINDWVKNATNNKIEDIVETPLNSDLVAILINALYFKGKWKYEFDQKQTDNSSFYLKDGTTKELPLMTLNGKLPYMETEDFQAVSLPYSDGEMSMNVFLPKENSSLEEFEKTLTIANLEKWLSKFREKEGTIMLPKFQLEYEVVLNDSLKKLGMITAFDKGANFTKMIQENDPLWISTMKQKTFIDLNEEGTEASAATSGEMVTESAAMDKPFRMEVNRPFFIVITDNETGMILFLGSIFNPQEGV